MKEYKGSTIIFYPRSYNKRGDDALHSMVGMTVQGNLINVKLRLDEKYLKRENPPSVSEFARNDYRAKMACIATDDNGPDNPEGILLLSKCKKEGRDNARNLDVYIARWADVIATDSLSPRPVTGISRVMIQQNSSQVMKLRSLMAQAKKNNQEAEATSYADQINDPKNWSYPVITYFPEEMASVSAGDRKGFCEKGAPLVDRHSKQGLIGGLAVRAISPSGQVIKNSYIECLGRFIVTESRYQTGYEMVQSLLEDWPEDYRDEVSSWDFWPIMRLNSGPYANRAYGESNAYSFVEGTYYYKDRPRVCNGLSRITYFEQTNTTLLSKHFKLGEPLGDPAKLNSQGGFSMTFLGEEIKLAQIKSVGVIIEEPDGILALSDYVDRAMWIATGSGSPIDVKKHDQEIVTEDISGHDEIPFFSESPSETEKEISEKDNNESSASRTMIEDTDYSGNDVFEIELEIDDVESEVEVEVESRSITDDENNVKEAMNDEPSDDIEAGFNNRKVEENENCEINKAEDEKSKELPLTGIAAFLAKKKGPF
jgi:hypothetical protein